MKNSILSIIFLLIVGYSYGQQVPLYTQYNTNPYVINPAYAGSSDSDHEFRTSFRNQWSGIGKAPKTGVFTYNGTYGRSGLGAMVFRDVIGDFKNAGLSLSYAYQIPLSDDFSVGFGIAAQFLQASLDLNLGDIPHIIQVDPAIISAIEGRSRFDVTPGLYAKGKGAYVGVSIPSLIQTYVSDNAGMNGLGYISTHFFALAGYRTQHKGTFNLEPSVLVRKVAAAPFEVDLNLKFWLDNTIMLGVSYRTSEESIAAMFGIQYEGFVLAFSNDFSTSVLNAVSQEITLGINLNKKGKE